MRHFEDFPEGASHDLGSTLMTAEAIIEYARAFDPMPFHLDPVAARNSPFGGLVASGWHTGAVVMGQFVRTLIAGSACLGSSAVDEVRFTRPVRPGDAVRGHAVVTEAALDSRAPGVGTVRFEVGARDRQGRPVYRMNTTLRFASRTAGAAGAAGNHPGPGPVAGSGPVRRRASGPPQGR